MIVGIDSMVLIYAGIVPASTGARLDKELRIRASLLLHQRQKDTIILPTVAVSEVLVPVPVSRKGALVAELSARFLCSPFDLHAASIASDIWQRHKKLPQDMKYHSRHVLRSDAMIIASALSAGATAFYSHDRKCRRLAALVVDAFELPKDDPNDMFLRGDIERGET